MKLTVVGTGYVGLVTGACLAEMGNDVLCLDVDAAKIAILERRRHADPRAGAARRSCARNVAAGRLHFTTDVAARACAHGTLQFIAVGTPPDEDGSADLQYVLAAARTIGRHMTDYKVVVDKSTVPVGTADKVRARHRRGAGRARRGASTSRVVSNPEFLKEGAAVETSCGPTASSSAPTTSAPSALMRELYAPFQRNHDKLVVMDVRSAELTKYAANAMLATRISFMNELALLAERVGADIEQVRQGIGSDPRIGYRLPLCRLRLRRLLLPEGREGADPHRRRDRARACRCCARWRAPTTRRSTCWSTRSCARFGDDLAGRRFALWGLAFKPNTDDMREAPSRVIIDELLARGASVQAYDPVAMDEARRVLGDAPGPGLRRQRRWTRCKAPMRWSSSPSGRSSAAPTSSASRPRCSQPVVFDGRNLFPPATVEAAGIEYHAIGRLGART